MKDLNLLREKINSNNRADRLRSARELGEAIQKGSLAREMLQEVNNHVHTTYSYSPYEPAAAAFAAWEAGLGIVGSVDHDSIGAAEEMLEASALLGIASTVGFEVRSGFQNTPFANNKVNNPDSPGIVYMCVHGVPQSAIPQVDKFLEPIRTVRNQRNVAQVEALNALLKGSPLEPIDFEKDVVPLSRLNAGGGITERHILHAFAQKILNVAPQGAQTVEFIDQQLGVKVSGKIKEFLLDENNPHYIYDLLGVLKSNYMPNFFIQPSPEEAVDVREVVKFGLSIGGIPAYAYLGDITESVTGDKKAEEFEDAYLDELVAFLAEIGFPAITYMPPRNTKAQMERLQQLCQKHNLMEISGVDINSSRQSFNCPELLEPEALHLVDSAWALVAHEKLVNHNLNWGLFSPDSPVANLPLKGRIELYSNLGRKMDPFNPRTVVELAQKAFG